METALSFSDWSSAFISAGEQSGAPTELLDDLKAMQRYSMKKLREMNAPEMYPYLRMQFKLRMGDTMFAYARSSGKAIHEWEKPMKDVFEQMRVDVDTLYSIEK